MVTPLITAVFRAKSEIFHCFRPGAKKSFVLLTCGGEEGAEDLSSAQYGDAMTLLSEQGIQLHLMTPLDLQFQGPSNRNRLLSRTYGFDANRYQNYIIFI